MSIVSTGTSYQLTLTSGIWDGINDANVTGNGSGTLTVTSTGIGAFTTAISITDTGSTGGDSVTFNNCGTNSYANSFTVNLSSTAAGAITFNGTSTFSGSSVLSASTTLNIVASSGARISTTAGNLTLSANQQATPTGGNFVGINVNDATIQSATGSVLLEGTGGNNSAVHSTAWRFKQAARCRPPAAAAQ